MEPRAWNASLVVVVFASVAGCGELLGVTNWVVTDAAAPNDATQQDAQTSDAGLDTGDDAKSCASPKSATGAIDGVLVMNEFCIDVTEATVASYNVFVQNSDPSMGQPPECAWNTTYQQGYAIYGGISNDSDYPQTTIDWCDAYAYCAYWGKHLCGNMTDGGAVDVNAEAVNPSVSQWYAACTNGTNQAYPYGNTYEPGACNVGSDAAIYDNIDPVPSSATCQGGVPGLYDMVGNVGEWENACVPGDAGAISDRCQVRGGPFFFSPAAANCQGDTGNYTDTRGKPDANLLNPWNGIRCCWEP